MKRSFVAAVLALGATTAVAARADNTDQIIAGKIAVKAPGESFYRLVDRPELSTPAKVLSHVRSKTASTRTAATPAEDAVYIRYATGQASLSIEHKLSRTDFLWSYTMGSPSLTVAVLDQPFDKDAPAINHAWDADNAYDIRNNDADPWLTVADIDPANGLPKTHGTSVASVLQSIACKGQTRETNPRGCFGAEYSQGVSPLAKVMPINICCAVVEGTEIRDAADDVTIANAVLYAARLPNSSGRLPSKKADAIVLSYDIFGSTGVPSAIVGEAITQAADAGVLFVTGAGNSRQSGKVINETSYTSTPGVIVAAAALLHANPTVDSSGFVTGYGPGEIALYSTPGSAVDVASDGDVTTSYPVYQSGQIAHSFAGRNGTSFTAPYVAGVFILAKSIYPALTPAQFDDWLKTDLITLPNATLGGTGEPRDNDFGFGIIDAQRVLSQVLAASSRPADVRPLLPVTVSAPATAYAGNAASTVVTVKVTNPYGTAAPMSQYQMSVSWSPALELSGIDTVTPGCEGDNGNYVGTQPAGTFKKFNQMFYYGGAQTCTLHYIFSSPATPTAFHFQIDEAGNDAANIAAPIGVDFQIVSQTPNVTSATLTATNTVEVGAPISLTWSAANASSCIATGSWSGDLPSSGTRTVAAPSAAGSYTYGVTCSNGNPSQASAAQAVTVTAKASGSASAGGGGGSFDPFLLISLLSFSALRRHLTQRRAH